MKSYANTRHTVIKSKGRFAMFVIFIVIMLTGLLTFMINMNSDVEAVENP